MSRALKAFRVRTQQGSVFAVRFEPHEVWLGNELGRMYLTGTAVSQGVTVTLEGLGAIPKKGGRVVVSATPYHAEEVEGEWVPFYPYETIVSVEEVPIPKELLLKWQTKETTV